MSNFRIVHMAGNGKDVFCTVSNLRTAKAILKDLHEIVSHHPDCHAVEMADNGWKLTYMSGWGIDRSPAWVQIFAADYFTSVREFRESGLYFVP